MLKTEKVKVVNELKDIMKDMDGFVLADFKGLTVEQITEFRNKVRETGAVPWVVKNRLLKIALNESKIEGLDDYLKQNTIFIYAKDDIVGPLKPIADFAKDNKEFEIKAGYISGDICNKDEVLAISKLPGRQQLIGMIAGGMNSVVTKFAGSVNAIITKFVGTIEAVENKKKEEA